MDSRTDNSHPTLVLTKQEQRQLVVTIEELRAPKSLQLIQELLVDCNHFLIKIESRFDDVIVESDDNDANALLLKYLLLSEEERKQFFSSLTNMGQLKNPSDSRGVITEGQVDTYNDQIKILIGDYKKMISGEIRIDNVQPLLELSDKDQQQLLAILDKSFIPSVVTIREKIERQQLLAIYKELLFPSSLLSIKDQLEKYSRLLAMIGLRFDIGAEPELDDSYALLEKFLLLTDIERQQLLESLLKLCCVKDPRHPDGLQVIKEQITIFNTFKQAKLPTDGTQAVFEKHLSLTDKERQQFLAIILNLCDKKNRLHLKEEMTKCNKLLRKVKTHTELKSPRNLYHSVTSTVELMNELVAYAQSQQIFISDSLSKQIAKIANRQAELSELFTERSKSTRDAEHEYIKKVGQPVTEEAPNTEKIPVVSLSTTKLQRSKKRVKYSNPDITEDVLLNLRITAICALLNTDLFLHLVENQIASFDPNELENYLNTTNAGIIKKIKTESELTELFTRLKIWRSLKPELTKISASLPLRDTISTLLSRITASEKSKEEKKLRLADYPPLTDNASRIMHIMPRNNHHVNNIEDILDLDGVIKRRYKTLELEKPLKQQRGSLHQRERSRALSTAPMPEFEVKATTEQPTSPILVPPLALPTLPTTAEIGEPRRQRGHMRRNQYRDMRGISLIALTSIFKPPRKTSDGLATSRTARSARDDDETNETLNKFY